MMRRALMAAVFIFFGLSVNTAFGFAANEHVAITAKVELSPQHIFGIQKNSTVKTNFRSDRVVRFNDTLGFQLDLLGLGDRPIRNRPVMLTLQATDSDQQLILQTRSNENGSATFEFPVSFAFSSDTYIASYSTTVENQTIDLLNTSLIYIYHYTFEHKNTAKHAVIEEHSFPQENSAQTAYSTTSNFATLEQVKKAYGFTDKIFKTPATFGAAARDGPVVLV